MPPKQRQVRMEQKGALASMQQLEQRSDEELEAESRHRAAAQAILGARAAERYDAKAARVHFQKAISAARPQERMQLRRMADASLALAERRAGDLKVAVEKLGQEAPSSRQLFMLRLTGILVPPPGSSFLLRARGVLLILLIIFALLAIGFGLATLVMLPFGGASIPWRVLIGIFILAAAFGVLYLVGRRRQATARAARAG
ncbi:MAG: hypothetical protein JHC95_06155 [Solirubrobacteraceae bacterium]|nr:hypothetical protein [Solirubrobacteraceae bacterium]